MEKFVLRIAAKRQVTLPARLLKLLRIEEGDMLELIVEAGSLSGHGLKLVPTKYFSKEMLTELEKREDVLDAAPDDGIQSTDQLSARLRSIRTSI